MAASKRIYVIDTCSFTTLHRAYSIEVFPSVWAKVEDLIINEQIFSVEEVYHEISSQDDALSGWAKSREGIFLPLSDELQDQTKEIINRYPKIVDFNKNKSGADPFVIAQAILLGGTVVSEERKSGGPDKLKIPDVCAELKVPHMKLFDLMKTEGMKF